MISFYMLFRQEAWRFDLFCRCRRCTLLTSLHDVSTQSADRAVNRDARDSQQNYHRRQNVGHVEESLQTPFALGGPIRTEVVFARSTKWARVTLLEQTNIFITSDGENAAYFGALSLRVIFDPFSPEITSQDISNNVVQHVGAVGKFAGGGRYARVKVI